MHSIPLSPKNYKSQDFRHAVGKDSQSLAVSIPPSWIAIGDLVEIQVHYLQIRFGLPVETAATIADLAFRRTA